MFIHPDKLILGADIGGSHITSGLVNPLNGNVLEESFRKRKIDTSATSSKIVIDQWIETIKDSLANLNGSELTGVGIAMPGPFDYINGISLLNGVNKYESLYGINIKAVLKNQLNLETHFPVLFENDAACFGLGEGVAGEGASFENIIAITLGTGFGASFIQKKKIVKRGKGIPDNGYLYNIPFKEGIAEDYISSRWLLTKFAELSGLKINEVKEIAELAITGKKEIAKEIFKIYGKNLAGCLARWIKSFKADCLIIGGNICKSSELFLPVLIEELWVKNEIIIPVRISKKMEIAAIAGAAELVKNMTETKKKKNEVRTQWRRSSQELMPQTAQGALHKEGEYNIYPFHPLAGGAIFSGHSSLADWIIEQKTVAIDGYIGNDWSAIRESLAIVFRQKKLSVLWYETSAFLKTENEIEKMVKPFLGKPDSVWGTKTTLGLEDFYSQSKLEKIRINEEYDITILIGIGSGLCKYNMPVIYVDLPKNEIQYRIRAGSAFNLGSSIPADATSMYKRFYFVDWVVLNNYRKKIKDKILVVADGQWKAHINWALHSSISDGLDRISRNVIRVRPWFEAGAWGGQWLKENIPSLNKNEINYAWSFELIVPENGLIFESNGNLLEISFDWLMECCPKEVLGKDENRFGSQFPIRFDFLDTFDGGELSIQCHPSLKYIQENFGETITQDETYYIMDCKKDAGVYLGFQEDINPDVFRQELEISEKTNSPIKIEKYVQKHASHKHDFFLIPNGTIHSSGNNNLVLEISATPYIFTFKMYDWVRPDLEGKPRPINIEHAFNNLNFERKGSRVERELVSIAEVIEKNEQYQIVHLPTHPQHFYDVHRIEFVREVVVNTNDQCHVLMLVEGHSIIVKTKKGIVQRFNYAETFVIPAAAESYQLINESGKLVKVIKAFIK
jgi:predicted NBD/HSP70 family sugar kinase/mannose-6-phosphate isomerase class I